MADVPWHLEALDDLDDIGAYIGRNSPAYAPVFVRRIFAAADRLVSFPESGRIVPEIDNATYREVIFQNYRVVYRLLGQDVVVIGVVHGSIDMEQIAKRRGWIIP